MKISEGEKFFRDLGLNHELRKKLFDLDYLYKAFQQQSKGEVVYLELTDSTNINEQEGSNYGKLE